MFWGGVLEVGADVEARAAPEQAGSQLPQGWQDAGSEYESDTEVESEGDELDLGTVPLRPLPAGAALAQV